MKIDIPSLRGLDAHRSALAEIAASLSELNAEADGRPFTDAERAEFEGLLNDQTTLAGIIEELEAREAAVTSALASPDPRRSERFAAPSVVKSAEDIFDIAGYRKRAQSIDDLPALYRDGAMRVIDQMGFPTAEDPKDQRGHLAKLVEKHRDDSNGWASAHVIGTGSPVYAEAWSAAMTGRPVSPRMLAVLQSYTDAEGGYALPVQIDPTFVNTSNGSINPMRQSSRVETITTKSWTGITTAGVTMAYVGERTTTGASDGAPTDIDDQGIVPVRADLSIDISLEYLQDYGATRLMGELGGLVQTAKDDMEAAKFAIGSGTGEPQGIVTGVAAVVGSVVSTATNDVFALADLDSTINSLGPRFRSRARWLGNLAIYQLARAFATAAQPGNSVYDDVSKILRGYPADQASSMDSTATDAKKILVLGDFLTGYVIVDRLGVTTKVIDTVDSSGRPTGGSTIYVALRNTGKVFAPNAFRLLKVQ